MSLNEILVHKKFNTSVLSEYENYSTHENNLNYFVDESINCYRYRTQVVRTDFTTIIKFGDTDKGTETNLKLERKYFNRWKNKSNQLKGENDIRARQKIKLNEFIKKIKNQTAQSNAESLQCKNTELSKPVGNFKHRYKAQKNIINKQQEKLEEQSKIINELKLGIIREDLLKSIENTKINIREIFKDCSENLLCRAPLIQEMSEREKIMISSQKAPKLVQRMQQRAIEREKYREVILERKKIIEEARQKLLEEAIAKKKAIEEEERQKNLEVINKQRKKELELQKIKQKRKQMFEEKISRAVIFYNNLLKKQCFMKLAIYNSDSKQNYNLAVNHYIKKTTSTFFNTWLSRVEAKYKIKYYAADAQFAYKTLQYSFNMWKEFKLECVRALQVAEDLYDFRLTSNTFIHWHRYVCKQSMIEFKKLQISLRHNNKRILFQYFYLWRSLPMFLQLEKAKEEKIRKWREKVWEILPDFSPPEPY